MTGKLVVGVVGELRRESKTLFFVKKIYLLLLYMVPIIANKVSNIDTHNINYRSNIQLNKKEPFISL